MLDFIEKLIQEHELSIPGTPTTGEQDDSLTKGPEQLCIESIYSNKTE